MNNILKYSVPDGLVINEYIVKKSKVNNIENITDDINTENKTISNDIYFKMVKNQDHKNKQKTRKYRK
jgi:hypothetical protein